MSIFDKIKKIFSKANGRCTNVNKVFKVEDFKYITIMKSLFKGCIINSNGDSLLSLCYNCYTWIFIITEACR